MKEKLLNWIKENQKAVFFSMIAISVFSIGWNINKFIVARNNPSTMEKFTENQRKIEEQRVEFYTQQAQLKNYIDQLEDYKQKVLLTKEDSLKIKYLIKKINENGQ
jgi:predicted negative regulator of RcsB-dependent stress response